MQAKVTATAAVESTGPQFIHLEALQKAIFGEQAESRTEEAGIVQLAEKLHPSDARDTSIRWLPT